MSTEITLKDESPAYTALKLSSKELASKVDKIVITDETTLAIAQQNISQLAGKIKEVAAIHKKEKAPAWDICKELDRLKNTLNDPMAAALDKGKAKVLEWDRAVRAKAAAETARIQRIKSNIDRYSAEAMKAFDACKTMEELKSERERIIVNYPKGAWGEFINDFLKTRVTLNDYAKAARTRIQTPAEVDPEESIAIKEAVEENNKAIVNTQAVPVQPSGIRKTWKHELVDITKVPIEWLTIDDNKVKAWRDSNKEHLTSGEVVDGVKFYQQESLTVK